MPKDVGRRYTTFLVAAPAVTAPGDGPVYAVMARRAEEALEIVRRLADAGPEVAIVGSLSSRTAKAIRLAAGEARPV